MEMGMGMGMETPGGMDVSIHTQKAAGKAVKEANAILDIVAVKVNNVRDGDGAGNGDDVPLSDHLQTLAQALQAASAEVQATQYELEVEKAKTSAVREKAEDLRKVVTEMKSLKGDVTVSAIVPMRWGWRW